MAFSSNQLFAPPPKTIICIRQKYLIKSKIQNLGGGPLSMTVDQEEHKYT